MSSTSPSPNSPVGPSAPASSNSTPPQPSSPPPNPRNSPPSPPPSAPPTTVSSPPGSLPPTSLIQSPMASPPPTSSPPPQPTVSPPPPANVPPPSLSPPPQPSSPPPTSPPPPVDPPARSPPPPPSTDPPNSPPPPSTNRPPPPSSISPVSPPPSPPQPSTPPPTTKPPENSSPPTQPPKSSPTPPSPKPPGSSPPPPLPTTPQTSPPPPPNSSTTPVPSRSPPPSPPSSNSPPKLSPPPAIQTSPPPPSFLSPPSPPSSSIDPPGIPSTNGSSGNAPQNSQSTSGGGIGTGGTVAIVLVLGLVFLGILGAAACCLRKRKKKASGRNGGYIMPTSLGSSQESDSALLKLQISALKNGSGSGIGVIHSPREPPGGFGHSRSWFTYGELVDATNGFSAQNLLGEGGFGSVYKGCLVDGRDVAVKQLKIGGGQGEREFRSEVEIINRIHHRHLVSLVGYCINENRRLLVYDYVPNNNLYYHLHGEGTLVLDWATRVRIALGAARGIAYLHEDCHPRIIHRDIKSSNILLDNNFEARVSDFGLAKLAVDANSHITTRVMGTFGYMAPEYASSGKLTERSDVYSFGVVLLELIAGRKPVDTSQPLGEESLVEWARPLLSQALETQDFGGLADPRLERQYVDGEMFRMIEAAAACVRYSSAKRPRMGQVVRALDTMASTDLTNGMRVGESEMFNSAQQSAEIRLFRRMAFGSQDYSTGFFSQDSWSSEGNQVNSRTE